jgi:putative transposase
MPAKWFGCRERRIGTQRIRDPLTALRLRMRELAQTRIRYGYRKIRVLLIREGWQVGQKLVYRIYR